MSKNLRRKQAVVNREFMTCCVEHPCLTCFLNIIRKHLEKPILIHKQMWHLLSRSWLVVGYLGRQLFSVMTCKIPLKNWKGRGQQQSLCRSTDSVHFNRIYSIMPKIAIQSPAVCGGLYALTECQTHTSKRSWFWLQSPVRCARDDKTAQKQNLTASLFSFPTSF